MESGRDRDLLVGVFAVQIRGITPERLTGAVAAWDADPSIPLGRRMVDEGLLEAGELQQLEQLVDESLAAHSGDAAAVLGLFGGEEHARMLFFGSASSSYLDHVDTAPMAGGVSVTGSGQGSSGVSETPGRYTLISHHAKGGMGRVLIVHDEHLGRNIALKELMPMSSAGRGSDKPTPIRQSASLIARFLQEARITSQLEHPAIVPVYELGRRQDGTLYYTMRLVRGKTFSAALRECDDIDGRLRLLSNFVSLCQAIAYAHSHHIIHRDIKPANVMLGQFGETVVLDWGLAKLRDAEDIHVEDIKDALHSLEMEGDFPLPVTAYGRALGTPHYMPPEQAAGQIEAIDERSDVYSLGAVLYEILTGTTPHSGRNTREIIEKVLHEAPVPVLKAVPDAPPELAVICEKALNRAPGDRYQSANELAAEVERFVQGSLVRAYRYSPAQILAHYYAKHRPLVNTVIACVLLLLAVGVGSYVSILRARDREHDQRLAAEAAQKNEAAARTIAERKTYQSQIQMAQAYLAGREPARAAEALWQTSAAERGWEWGYLLNRANPEAYTVETPNTNLYAAVFSPDGSRIGTNTHPAVPSLYDAVTGKKLLDFQAEPTSYMQTLFSPDGTLYAGVGAEGVINVWDTATGGRVQRFEQHAMGSQAVFNAAGTLLLAGYGDGKVRAYDLKTGTVAYALEVAEASVGALAMSPGKDRLLTLTGDGSLQLWDLATRAPLFALSGLFPVFSPDGTRIAAVQGSEAVLWDAETGAELRRFKGHQLALYDLHFSRDGGRLLSASQDGSVILWDTATAALLQRYTVPDAVPVSQAFFLADESAVLAYSAHNSCLIFAGALKSPVCQFQGRGKDGWHAELQPKGPLFLMAPGEHLFQVVNPLAPTGIESVLVDARSGADSYSALAASASGSALAATNWGRGGTSLIDVAAKRRNCAFAAAFGRYPEKAALSDDGARLALLVDGFVPAIVGEPAGTPSWAVFGGHSARVTALALRPDGKQAASGDASGNLFLWNAESAQTEKTLSSQGDAVSCLSFSRDGQHLLSATMDGVVTLWASGTGAAVRALPKQAQPMVAAAFNDSAARILTVDSGGAAQLWDSASGRPLEHWQVGVATEKLGWDRFAINARFWPGDRLFLASLPFEGKKLWDAANGTPLVFLADNEAVLPMNGGRTLAVVDDWGTVRTEHIPDSDSALTRESYAQYQREWAARTALTIEAKPPKTRMFISSEDLALALSDLARVGAETAGPQGVSLAVADSTRTQSMAAAGLGAGDGVTALNGTVFTGADAARAALATAAQQLAGNPRGTVSATLSRGGQAWECIYWALPLQRDERPVTVTREDAVGLVQWQLDTLATDKEVNPKAAWLGVSSCPYRDIADRMKLPGEVAMIAIDGTPFDSMGAVEQALNLFRQRIADGSLTTFSQTFREGVFREHTRTFTVSQ